MPQTCKLTADCKLQAPMRVARIRRRASGWRTTTRMSADTAPSRELLRAHFARTSAHHLATLALCNRLRPSATRTPLSDGECVTGVRTLRRVYFEELKLATERARKRADAALALAVRRSTCDLRFVTRDGYEVTAKFDGAHFTCALPKRAACDTLRVLCNGADLCSVCVDAFMPRTVRVAGRRVLCELPLTAGAKFVYLTGRLEYDPQAFRQ